MGINFNIVVLGPKKVGKSALVKQFLQKDFVNFYLPTVEDSYNYIAKMPDGSFRYVTIIDTAGSDDFPVMRKLRIKHADAFFIVYSVDDSKSYANAKYFYQQIYDVKGTTELPIVLIGNKMDSGRREVSTEEGARYAKEDLNCFHLETSAKCNLNVVNVFTAIIWKTFDVKSVFGCKYAKKRKEKFYAPYEFSRRQYK